MRNSSFLQSIGEQHFMLEIKCNDAQDQGPTWEVNSVPRVRWWMETHFHQIAFVLHDP